MRQNKFRVYLKEEETMLYSEEDIDNDFMEIWYFDRVEIQEHKFKEGGGEIYETCDYVRPEQSNLMQYIGIKCNNDLYESDILRFTPNGNGFEYSKQFEIMKEHDCTSLLIIMEDSEYLGVMYKVYFEREGVVLTERDWYKYTDEAIEEFKDYEKIELYNAYYQTDRDISFLQYLSRKDGLKIIGNIYENPELLP